MRTLAVAIACLIGLLLVIGASIELFGPTGDIELDPFIVGSDIEVDLKPDQPGELIPIGEPD